MKAFQFKLGALLRLKETKKDQALSNLAKAIQKVALTEQKLERSKGRFDKIIDLIKKHQKMHFDVVQMKILHDSLQDEKENLEKIQLQLNHCRDIENSRRKIFLDKDSQYKALLRLKEKQQEQHFLSESNKEQKELEDIIAARFLFHSNPAKF